MFHPHTQRVIEEWRRQRGANRLPARPQMAAAAFGPLLPQVFVLGRDAGSWRFRLAGGLLTDLHGRELRGESFGGLWQGLDQARAGQALDAIHRAARPLILSAEIQADDAGDEMRRVGLEISLLPLTGPTGEADRVLGFYQPTSMTARLRGAAAVRMRLLAIQESADALAAPVQAQPRLRLVAENGRRVA